MKRRRLLQGLAAVVAAAAVNPKSLAKEAQNAGDEQRLRELQDYINDLGPEDDATISNEEYTLNRPLDLKSCKAKRLRIHNCRFTLTTTGSLMVCGDNTQQIQITNCVFTMNDDRSVAATN